MRVKTSTPDVPALWSNQIVDMPGMGPGGGAEKAGWWVAYFQELMLLGRYDEIFKWLSVARHTGAITTITKAKEELIKLYVQGKKESNSPANTKVRTGEYQLLPKKCLPKIEEKIEPYFYSEEKRGAFDHERAS